MASTILSALLSAPPTSRLNAPEEMQRPSDFASTHTESLFLEDERITEPGLDLLRVPRFELSHTKKKLKSFVWTYGWRIVNEDGLDHWLCRECHIALPRPKRPKYYLFRTNLQTTGPVNHLRDVHHIDADGAVPARPRKAPTSGGSRQASITGFTSSSAGPGSPFDYQVFKGLLLQLFTTRPLPFDLVEDPAFKSLLTYCQPLLADCIPSRRTLRRYIGATYSQSLTVVENHLQTATTKVNLSFDLWTSLGRKLSLLGVVAHYLDASFSPRAILLALPRMQGSHSAINLSQQLALVLRHFRLGDSFGNAITDNASENAACLDILGDELFIDTRKRHVRCMGHVINLVAQAVLFGEDVESFEDSIANVTTEEVELRTWRRKGPIGKLHNLIRFICYSEQRRSLFLKVQREQPPAMRSQRLRGGVYELKHDNLTRWNSWYDAAERALDLRTAVDDTVDLLLSDYYQKVTRYNLRKDAESTSQAALPPKAPSLFYDRLSNDDWQVIAVYVKLMKPLKDATMKL